MQITEFFKYVQQRYGDFKVLMHQKARLFTSTRSLKSDTVLHLVFELVLPTYLSVQLFANPMDDIIVREFLLTRNAFTSRALQH